MSNRGRLKRFRRPLFDISSANKFGQADPLRFFAQQTRGHALEISPPPLHFINV